MAGRGIREDKWSVGRSPDSPDMLLSAAATDGAPELGRPGCLQGTLLSVMELGPLWPREVPAWEGAVSQSTNHTLGAGGQDGNSEKEKVERGASWTQLTVRFPFSAQKAVRHMSVHSHSWTGWSASCLLLGAVGTLQTGQHMESPPLSLHQGHWEWPVQWIFLPCVQAT